MRKNNKGQGMTEFALILPLLLLLLLGIIEASRVIWAYITVQAAAREAARYAVTGQPYVNVPTVDVCRDPEGQKSAGATDPWLCTPEDRVEAIKKVAVNRGDTLGISVYCTTPGSFNAAGCADEPGAFGVQVIGQAISPTLSYTSPITMTNHAGTQGLNVLVSTYYNVTMLDPIFEAIMGGEDSFIQLRGEVQMQNEGVDAAMGAIPPPPIATPDPGSGGGPGSGTGAEIWSLVGYTVLQGQDLLAHLDQHNPNQNYDIFLGTYKICTLNSGSTGNVDAGPADNCLVTFSIPPGYYDLYSVVSGGSTPFATDPQQVEVQAPYEPTILVKDPISGNQQNVWAANSQVEIQLIAHQTPDEPFNIYFDYGGPDEELIAADVEAVGGTIPLWKVPEVGTKCPIGGTPCSIQTRRVDDESEVYAEVLININQPVIALQGGNTNRVFAQGETMHIFLRGHTPGFQYDLKLSGPNGTIALGRSPATNSLGNTTVPINWTVLMAGQDVNWPLGWPNGLYDITSHPAIGGTPDLGNMTSANQIAVQPDVEVQTPSGPYITVDGGYVWPIDSFINIKVHKHPVVNNPYYLEFGPWRVSTPNSEDTFDTGGNETAVVPYRIPITATEGVEKDFTIASYIHSNDQLMAEREVTVFPVPVIRVLEGDRVLRDATITILITNHAPNSSYTIIYANKPLLEVLTDEDGRAMVTYDLKNLPDSPPPNLSDPANYGIYFDMYSQDNLAGSGQVATTQLAIDSADLAITAIQFPPEDQIEINTTVPVSVTIQNLRPVTISRYFDIDLYFDPEPPLIPTQQFNFPGDIKLWRNQVGPFGESNDTFTVVEDFFVGEYGQHELYSYADTTDFVFAESNEANNLDSNTFDVSCVPSAVVDTFDALASPEVYSGTYQFDSDAELNDWSESINPGRGSAFRDGSNQLVLDHENQSTHQSSDNYYIYHLNTPVVGDQTEIDISVKIVDAPDTTQWAKAGLGIRNGLANNVPKVELALARHKNKNKGHRIQTTQRDSPGDSATRVPGWDENSEPVVDLADGPVWLRLRRKPGTDIFEYYYKRPTDSDWVYYTEYEVVMTGETYLYLYGSTYNSDTYQSKFDDFSYYYLGGSSIPGWVALDHGNAEANPDPTISGGHLILSSDGTSTWGGSDNNLIFYKTDPVDSSGGLDLMVQIFDAPSNRQWAKAGLEIRNTPDANSKKIDIGLAWDGSTEHHVQVGYRPSAGSGMTGVIDSDKVTVSDTNPVWLRIVREAGTNTFKFYYLEQDPMPTEADWQARWGTDAYASIDTDMNDELYVGLFNASYDNGTYRASEFDNFSVTDLSTCEPAQGKPGDDDVPPGLTVCTDPLAEKSFETIPAVRWRFAFEENVAQSPGSAHTGNYKLAAHSFDGGYFNPYFYQKFTMPSWIISSTTTLDLSLYKNIDNLSSQGSSDDSNDRFYVAVATAPDVSATLVTSPTVIADGVMGTPVYDPLDWRSVDLQLPVADGINLEDYADQELYLFFYNRSNALAGCPPGGVQCHATKFYFDDIDLEACTQQPLPATISTRIKGSVTLHPTGAPAEKIDKVKVWAYAEDGELYETLTIQNGEFNFYNLPATATGIKYHIYAEYYIQDPLDPSQVEILTDNKTVILRTTNNNGNPVTTKLDLYAIF